MICCGCSSPAELTNAIDFPSGDQRGELSGPAAVDTRVNVPPSAGMTHTSGLRPSSSNSWPLRSETNAILVPSGDHCGSVSFQASPLVICFAAPVDMSTVHRCDRLSSNQPLSLNLYELCV